MKQPRPFSRASEPPPSEPIAEPTSEMKSRHHVRERHLSDYRKAFAVETRVDRLHQQGRIDDAQYQACLRFYADWAIGIEGVSEPADTAVRGPNIASPGGPSERRLIATSNYLAAKDGVGRFAGYLLELVVCIDADMPAVARLTKCTRDEAPVLTVICIKALAEHYHRVDNTARRQITGD